MDSVNIRLSILTETTVELLGQLSGLEGASSIDETGNNNFLAVFITVYILIYFYKFAEKLSRFFNKIYAVPYFTVTI